MLQFIPNYYKTPRICEKVVDYYLHALEYVSDCHMTKEPCEKTIDTYPNACL